MAKRFTDTDKWNDPWFSDLNPDMKLAWQYICDTCNHAGIWNRNFKNLRFHCDSTRTDEEIEAIFHGRFHTFNDDKWLIPKFLKFQYPKGLHSNKPAIVSVRNAIIEAGLVLIVKESLGNDYIMIKEPLDNGLITVKDKDIDKDMDKDKNNIQDVTEEPETKAPKKIWEPKDVPMRLAADLFMFMKRNETSHREPNLQEWADTMDKIMRIDGHVKEMVFRVLLFSQFDSFWKQTCHSPTNLRKNFLKIKAKAKGWVTNISTKTVYKMPNNEDIYGNSIMS